MVKIGQSISTIRLGGGCVSASLSKVDSNTPYLKLVQMHEKTDKWNCNGRSYGGSEAVGKRGNGGGTMAGKKTAGVVDGVLNDEKNGMIGKAV